MVEKENIENEEEPELKVTDRRKFNVDGSLREGVSLEPEEPKKRPAIAGGEAPKIVAPDGTAASPERAAEPKADETAESEKSFADDNPASFINFLSTLVTNAAASLGAMPHPVTGQKSVDLETGKYWIDVLQMLRDKTRNNLDSKETQLLEGILSDLQLQYVSLSRAAEQKLKADAAKKFSAKDILGK